MSLPENGKVPLILKRRRTRRHQRNRLVRRWLGLSLLAIFVATLSAFALRYFSPSMFGEGRASGGETERYRPGIDRAVFAPIFSDARSARPVYPYSVVPGGVEDIKELKWVAEHDPIVGAHYAGFNYAHAQVVRLTLARTVYLSYRIGNQIYWTSHRVTLHKGERLITDGRMTARTRCANRVEESPQQQSASPAEPPAQKFDEPLRAGEGIATNTPAFPFESALTRPQMPGFETVGPMSLYDPFVGGNFIPLSPPPLPAALCAPTKNKGTSVTAGKKNSVSCEVISGPSAVPEPATWALFASGLVFIFWQAHRKRRAA